MDREQALAKIKKGLALSRSANEHEAAAALRQAQLSLLPEQPHPCHWAAFTLHGGW
jgi:CHAT domain-containing protein